MAPTKLRESRRYGKDSFFQLIEYRLRRLDHGIRWDDTLHSLAAMHNQSLASGSLAPSSYDIGTYDEVNSFLFREDKMPCQVMKKAFRGVPGYSSVVLNPNAKYGAIAILGNARCFYATLLVTKRRPTIPSGAVILPPPGGIAPHVVRENEEHVISQRLPSSSAGHASASSSSRR